MLCPCCGFHIPEQWSELTLPDDLSGLLSSGHSTAGGTIMWVEFHVFAMACPNEECKEVLVEVNRDAMFRMPSRPSKLDIRNRWFAVPKKAGLPVVDNSIPEQYKRGLS